MEIFSKIITIPSNELAREVNLQVFGKYGFTLLAFPTVSDDFNPDVDAGFVNSVSNYIANGLFRMVFVPTIENRIWKNSMERSACSELHKRYNNFLLNEVLPKVFQIAGSPSPIITFGCGEAGYFAGNTYFRHPDIFYGTIAIDAYFDIHHLSGYDYWDDNCYFNSPLDFLRNLEEEYWLIHLRAKKQVHIIALDEEDNQFAKSQALTLADILSQKRITHKLKIENYEGKDKIEKWQNAFKKIIEESI
ncbi:hypothetical protein D9V84_05595 [Bacteroidetes/Chlorobi group bacterium Naka2016]|jgi:esterase/lipase superfamily enzyme|nr:MAG: hypothetical protein D9V84_05595 [Bacteroidetes/Chlorobi group bacterium Naka2016]